jgi:hypothetical protein
MDAKSKADLERLKAETNRVRADAIGRILAVRESVRLTRRLRRELRRACLDSAALRALAISTFNVMPV